MNAKTRLISGFAVLVLSAIAGWWFARHYHRIGPEAIEPLVLLIGSLVIIAAAAFGFLQLVRGMKRLDG